MAPNKKESLAKPEDDTVLGSDVSNPACARADMLKKSTTPYPYGVTLLS
ncbi:hypothetical protein BZL30_9210 [Mycobacterium kansasii]|uniref:Uncharacterized protein n=1 Tax=Mycobacterium kansasii TaxID=1768 RepID=A0A1V3WB26_MYCKA|nr:hypothetical protein BZL30_9210 [Mycobacterium kansasii]